MARMRRHTVSDVAEEYGIARGTILQMMHAGAFGEMGRGWHAINPDSKRPQYRITDYGIAQFEKRLAS